MYEPKVLNNFIGQEDVKTALQKALYAANLNERPIEHIVFYGPPGLGKTTLGRIIANEVGTRFIEVTAANFKKRQNIEEILFNLDDKDIIFVDECHNIPPKIEELLYSPLEYFKYEGIPINRFTFIGATTSAGQLTKPFRDRILHQLRLNLYSLSELSTILQLHGASQKVADFIAIRSRGIPRQAINFYRLSQNERDTDLANINKPVQIVHAYILFERLRIDKLGLNYLDREVLEFLSKNRQPSGLNALSITLDIDNYDLKNLHEPWLLQLGFIKRTARGRVITRAGTEYANQYIVKK